MPEEEKKIIPFEVFHALQYAHQQFLSKPYQDCIDGTTTDLEGFLIAGEFFGYSDIYVPYSKETKAIVEKKKLIESGQVAFRPNHGNAHNVRVVTNVADVLEHYTKQPSAAVAQFLAENSNKDELLKKIQITTAFMITGRQSDIGYHDNNAKFEEYKHQSKENFMAYLKQQDMIGPGKLFKDIEEANLYKSCVDSFIYTKDQYPGNDKYSKQIVAFNERYDVRAIKLIIGSAHALDLSRCFNPGRMNNTELPNVLRGTNYDTLDPNSIEAKEIKQATMKLFSTAAEKILATGDKLSSNPNKDTFKPSQAIQKQRTPELFMKNETNLAACLSTMQYSVATPEVKKSSSLKSIEDNFLALRKNYLEKQTEDFTRGMDRLGNKAEKETLLVQGPFNKTPTTRVFEKILDILLKQKGKKPIILSQDKQVISCEIDIESLRLPEKDVKDWVSALDAKIEGKKIVANITKLLTAVPPKIDFNHISLENKKEYPNLFLDDDRPSINPPLLETKNGLLCGNTDKTLQAIYKEFKSREKELGLDYGPELTPELGLAITVYTTGAYRDMNLLLRTGGVSEGKLNQEEVDSHYALREILLSTTMAIDALNKIPNNLRSKHAGNKLGHRAETGLDKQALHHVVEGRSTSATRGGIVHEKAFTSTSDEPLSSSTFGKLKKEGDAFTLVTGLQDKYIAPFSACFGEAENLQMPTQMMYTRHLELAGKHLFVAKPVRAIGVATIEWKPLDKDLLEPLKDIENDLTTLKNNNEKEYQNMTSGPEKDSEKHLAQNAEYILQVIQNFKKEPSKANLATIQTLTVFEMSSKILHQHVTKLAKLVEKFQPESNDNIQSFEDNKTSRWEPLSENMVQSLQKIGSALIKFKTIQELDAKLMRPGNKQNNTLIQAQHATDMFNTIQNFIDKPSTLYLEEIKTITERPMFSKTLNDNATKLSELIKEFQPELQDGINLSESSGPSKNPT